MENTDGMENIDGMGYTDGMENALGSAEPGGEDQKHAIGWN